MLKCVSWNHPCKTKQSPCQSPFQSVSQPVAFSSINESSAKKPKKIYGIVAAFQSEPPAVNSTNYQTLFSKKNKNPSQVVLVNIELTLGKCQLDCKDFRRKRSLMKGSNQSCFQQVGELHDQSASFMEREAGAAAEVYL